MCFCVYGGVCVYIYIYIYKVRERQRDREREHSLSHTQSFVCGDVCVSVVCVPGDVCVLVCMVCVCFFPFYLGFR